MSVQETIPAIRAVVCSRDASLARRVSDQLGQAARCLWAATPYEAAAEALAGEADLAVVDLAAIAGAHAGLLGVLRRHGVRVLAIGGPSDAAALEPFEGLTVAAREGLDAAMADFLAAGPEAQPPQDAPAPAAPPVSPRGLVSPEELAALLEDQP